MPKYDHDSAAIADRYARALLDLSEESQSSDDVLVEFEEFVSIFAEDKAFEAFMTDTAIDRADRRRVLEKHFRGRISDLLLNAMQVINQKDRTFLIPLILEKFRLALEARRNEVEVHVTAAVELNDVVRDRLQQAATRISGKWARLIEKVDPSILGGLVVRIHDEKMDASVLRRLQRMRDVLSDRASREIHSGKEYFESAGA